MIPVLVVDDHESIRVVREILADEGYPVIEAGDGDAALRASPRPLLVLLDDRLPGLSGTELLAPAAGEPALRRHAYTLATARDPEAGVPPPPIPTAILRKPFDLDGLLAAVAAMARALRAAAGTP